MRAEPSRGGPLVAPGCVGVARWCVEVGRAGPSGWFWVTQQCRGNRWPDAPIAGRAVASQPCREPASLAGPCQVPPGRRRGPSMVLMLNCVRPSSQCDLCVCRRAAADVLAGRGARAAGIGHRLRARCVACVAAMRRSQEWRNVGLRHCVAASLCVSWMCAAGACAVSVCVPGLW